MNSENHEIRNGELNSDPDKKKKRKEKTSDEIHVAGDDALVVASVVVLAGLGRKSGAMAAVVNEEEVPWLRRLDESGESLAGVLAGGLSVGVVAVDENGDVVLGETESLDKAVVHPLDVVDASSQLRLRSRIVASDQHRFLPHLSLKLSDCLAVFCRAFATEKDTPWCLVVYTV